MRRPATKKPLAPLARREATNVIARLAATSTKKTTTLSVRPPSEATMVRLPASPAGEFLEIQTHGVGQTSSHPSLLGSGSALELAQWSSQYTTMPLVLSSPRAVELA